MSKKIGILLAVIVTGCLGWHFGRASMASKEELTRYAAADAKARATSEIAETTETKAVVEAQESDENNAQADAPTTAVKEGTHEYCVLQQFNSMCHIAPIYNFKILNEVLLPALDQEEKGTISADKKGPEKEVNAAARSAQAISLNQWQDDIPFTKWLSQREWFGYAHRYLEAWHSAFARVNITDARDPNTVPALREYLKKAVEEGPVTPHYYNAEGKFYFAPSGSFSRLYFGQNLKAIVKFICTPYLLIHTTAKELKYLEDFDRPGLGLNVPIAREDKSNNYLMYDVITNTWNPVFTEPDNDAAIAKIRSIQLTYGSKSQTLTLNDQSKKPALGFSAFGYDYNLGHGFFTHEGSDPKFEYVPYMAGLYKLMLLSLGIDENNDTIDNKSALYGVYQDLRKLKASNPEFNLWNERYFKIEDFLQYHIAQILKENEKLCAQAKATVDFSDLKYWQAYTDFLNATETKEHKASIFSDENGEKPYVYQNVIKYIPGPEQMLASIITTHIRLLWYGTLSPKAFYAATTHEEIGLLWWLFAGGTWRFEKDYRDKALVKINLETGKHLTYHASGIGELLEKEAESKEAAQARSFMDTWHAIVKALKTKFSTKNNWISFDEHGMVLSFDKRLMALQAEALQQAKVEDCDDKIEFLNKQLKCACIESWHGSLLPAFYKRKRDMATWAPRQQLRITLSNQTTLLRTAERLFTTLDMLEPLKESSKKIAALIEKLPSETRATQQKYIGQLKTALSDPARILNRRLLDKKTVQKLEAFKTLADQLPTQDYIDALARYQQLKQRYDKLKQFAANTTNDQQKRFAETDSSVDVSSKFGYFLQQTLKNLNSENQYENQYLAGYCDPLLKEISDGEDALQRVLDEKAATTGEPDVKKEAQTP